jgi:hypothetical protein
MQACCLAIFSTVFDETPRWKGSFSIGVPSVSIGPAGLAGAARAAAGADAALCRKWEQPPSSAPRNARHTIAAGRRFMPLSVVRK